MTIAWIAGLSAASFVFVNAALLLWFRRDLVALWQEPVLCCPVLIIESDDWGAGPPEQADRLERLAAVLASYHDCRGHPAVMTLGVVLAVPDGPAMQQSSTPRYQRRYLSDSCCARIRDAMLAGQTTGVFELQLHGLEHYWPAALEQAAERDPHVRDWTLSIEPPATEDLPSALQTRWADGSRLPSVRLPEAIAERTAAEEVASFRATLGCDPLVAVPPTFVWPLSVEAGWSAAGVEVVITPAQRYEARDASGQLVPAGPRLLNGQRSETGLCYLVRNVYLEPSFGHSDQDGLDGLGRKWRTGRPALMETHRFNFLGREQDCERAFSVLKAFLAQASARYPNLRFTTPAALARAFRDGDEDLVTRDWDSRMRAWLNRLPDVRGMWRLARISGGRVAVALALRLLS
jgi:hypothetical protein